MVHPGGRPRTSSPSPEEVIELGKDLVEWASTPPENGDPFTKMRFCDWYSGKHWMIMNEWKALRKLPEFVRYYERARGILARKFMKAGEKGEINPGIAQRFLRHYIQDDIKEEEDALIEHEARAKALIDTSDNERKIIERDQRIIELEAKLRELQSK